MTNHHNILLIIRPKVFKTRRKGIYNVVFRKVSYLIEVNLNLNLSQCRSDYSDLFAFLPIYIAIIQIQVLPATGLPLKTVGPICKYRCDIANQFDAILDVLIFKVITNNQFIHMKNKAKRMCFT